MKVVSSLSWLKTVSSQKQLFYLEDEKVFGGDVGNYNFLIGMSLF